MGLSLLPWFPRACHAVRACRPLPARSGADAAFLRDRRARLAHRPADGAGDAGGRHVARTHAVLGGRRDGRGRDLGDAFHRHAGLPDAGTGALRHRHHGRLGGDRLGIVLGRAGDRRRRALRAAAAAAGDAADRRRGRRHALHRDGRDADAGHHPLRHGAGGAVDRDRGRRLADRVVARVPSARRRAHGGGRAGDGGGGVGAALHGDGRGAFRARASGRSAAAARTDAAAAGHDHLPRHCRRAGGRAAAQHGAPAPLCGRMAAPCER